MSPWPCCGSHIPWDIPFIPQPGPSLHPTHISTCAGGFSSPCSGNEPGILPQHPRHRHRAHPAPGLWEAPGIHPRDSGFGVFRGNQAGWEGRSPKAVCGEWGFSRLHLQGGAAATRGALQDPSLAQDTERFQEKANLVPGSHWVLLLPRAGVWGSFIDPWGSPLTPLEPKAIENPPWLCFHVLGSGWSPHPRDFQPHGLSCCCSQWGNCRGSP